MDRGLTPGGRSGPTRYVTVPEFNAAMPGTTVAYGSPTTILTAAAANPTLGTGSSANAFFTLANKWVFGRIEVVCGTSGVAGGSGNYQFLLPVAPRAGTIAALGQGAIQANGPGGQVDTYAPLLWVSGTIANIYPPGLPSVSSGTYNVVANRRYLIDLAYEVS